MKKKEIEKYKGKFVVLYYTFFDYPHKQCGIISGIEENHILFVPNDYDGTLRINVAKVTKIEEV